MERDDELVGKLCIKLKNLRYTQTKWDDDAREIVAMVRAFDKGDGHVVHHQE